MRTVYLRLLNLTMELSQGAYTIQGINVLDLAQQFGTPLYIYDGEKIAQQIKTLRNAFSDTDIKVKYAAKALTNISILKLIRKHGAGVEVVSLGEAHIAMKAGFTPAEIVFTPSGVEFSEIEEAVEILKFQPQVADTLQKLDQVASWSFASLYHRNR